FQAEDGIRGFHVTGVQTCALPISRKLYQLIKQALEQPPTPLAKTSGAQPSEAATRPATVEHVAAAPEHPRTIPPTGPMPAVPTTPEKEYSPSVPAPADTQAAANRDAGE